MAATMPCDTTIDEEVYIAIPRPFALIVEQSWMENDLSYQAPLAEFLFFNVMIRRCAFLAVTEVATKSTACNSLLVEYSRAVH